MKRIQRARVICETLTIAQLNSKSPAIGRYPEPDELSLHPTSPIFSLVLGIATLQADFLQSPSELHTRPIVA
jgi:hypothetical protein